MDAKALKTHQKSSVTLALRLLMASQPYARECLLIFCPLANGRRRPAHSWLLILSWLRRMPGLTQPVAAMTLRAAPGEAQGSTEGESIPFPGARLRTAFSPDHSGRPSSHSFSGEVSSLLSYLQILFPVRAPPLVSMSL